MNIITEGMPEFIPCKCMKREEDSISEEAAKNYQYNRRRSAVTEVTKSILCTIVTSVFVFFDDPSEI